MESSDLFSHPYEPEAVPTPEASSEEVQVPAFPTFRQRFACGQATFAVRTAGRGAPPGTVRFARL